MCTSVDAETASGLIAARLYEGAQLPEPSGLLCSTVANNMAKILEFLEKNSCLRNVAKTAASVYPLPTFSFCCDVHRTRFELLYTQLIIRVFCKNINRSFKESRRIIKKIKEIYLNLNRFFPTRYPTRYQTKMKHILNTQWVFDFHFVNYAYFAYRPSVERTI